MFRSTVGVNNEGLIIDNGINPKSFSFKVLIGLFLVNKTQII